MAVQAVDQDGYHQALVAATEAQFSVENVPAVKIMNVTGAAPISYTISGTTPIADGTTGKGRIIPGVAGAEAIEIVPSGETITINVISSGTPQVAIQPVLKPDTIVKQL